MAKTKTRKKKIIKKTHAKTKEPTQKTAVETLAENQNQEPKPKSQRQQDLTWLIGRPDIVAKYQGNYVAVYREHIIAVAPCEHLIHQAVINQPDIDSEQTLIVPLNIAGSEYLWEELQATLDN